MKKYLLGILVFLSCLPVFSQSTFQRVYGSKGNSDEVAKAAAPTPDGGFIVTGVTYWNTAGNGDVFLLKLDGAGNQQWLKNYGGAGYDVGYSVAPTADGGYILCGTTDSEGDLGGDAFVRKVSASGVEQWKKVIGDQGYEGATSVQPTSDGGYILCGSNGSFGGSPGQIFFTKLDASGNTVFYGTNSDRLRAYTIVEAPGGGYFAGVENGLLKIGNSGGIEWEKQYTDSGTGAMLYHITQIVPASDGTIWLAGNEDLGSILFARILADGTLVQTFYSAQSGSVRELRNIGDQWFAITGNAPDLIFTANSTVHWYVFNAALELLHTQALSGAILYNNEAATFAVDGNDLKIIGNTRSNLFQYDVAFVRYNNLQTPFFQAQKNIGAAALNGNEIGDCVRVTSDNGYIVSGSHFTLLNGLETWILKLNAQGDILWESSLNFDQQPFLFEDNYGMEVLPAGSTVLLTTTGDNTFLSKLSPTGTLLWTKNYPVTLGFKPCLQKTADGGFVAALRTQWPDNQLRTRLVRFNANGDTLWTRRFGESADISYSLYADTDGSFLLGGRKLINGTPIERKMWVTRISPSGNIIWENTYGTSIFSRAIGLTKGSDGAFYATGYAFPDNTLFNSDALLVKINPANGAPLWEKILDTNSDDWWPYALRPAADGNFFMLSLRTPLVNNNYAFELRTAVVNKISPSGTVLCDETFGLGGAPIAYEGEATADGGFVFAGYYWDGITNDLFVVKTNADCTVSMLPVPIPSTSSLSVSPYPGSGTNCLLTLASPVTGEVAISIVTPDGRAIRNWIAEKTGDTWQQEVNLGVLPAGTYLIRAAQGKAQHCVQWIKM